LNVTGGSLFGSKLLKKAVPNNALAMGLLSSKSKATETSKLFKSVKRFPALSKSEETLVASSSAPVNEIAGLGRVKIEKIDPSDMAGSKKRFDKLKALTSGYKQDRAKAKIIRLENGENAIQYMQPPTEVKKLNISELIATQDNVVLGTNKTAGDVMPLVVKKDGKFFIRDGHHRIAQNINSGDKTANVRVIDLDKGGFLGVKATKSADDVKILDDAGSLARAREQGFDVDNPVYHGTNADKLTEFKESTIGTATDQGFFGRGFYFADNSGEAGYYGKNVGKYVVKGKLLDLSNKTGDYTLGPVQFIDWAKKLDNINMLDVDTKNGLKAAQKIVKYVDDKVEYRIFQNPDGTDGFSARIVDPTREPNVYKGVKDPIIISTRSGPRNIYPKSKEEAKTNLLNTFAFEMKNSTYKTKDYFKGWDVSFNESLSDYIRVGGKGSAELTKQAKKAGFDGVKAGDETVIFDPKNIRSIDAKFDPAKADSPDLLSSVDTQTTRFG